MSMLVITKRPDEKYALGLIYEAPDIEEGQVCQDCTVEVDPVETGGLEPVFNAVVEDDRVSVMVASGLDSHDYKLKFSTTVSSGHIYEGMIFVKVRNY